MPGTVGGGGGREGMGVEVRGKPDQLQTVLPTASPKIGIT